MARFQFVAALCLVPWLAVGAQATQSHENPIVCATGCLNAYKDEFVSQHLDPYEQGCRGRFPNSIACCVVKSCPEGQWEKFCGKDVKVPDAKQCPSQFETGATEPDSS